MIACSLLNNIGFIAIGMGVASFIHLTKVK